MKKLLGNLNIDLILSLFLVFSIISVLVFHPKSKDFFNRYSGRGEFQEDLSAQQEELIKEKISAATDNLRNYMFLNYTNIPDEFVDIIAANVIEMCYKHKISSKLIVGLIEVESMFNPMAVSKVGARGLMQVMPSVWAKEFNIKNERELHDVVKNLDIGIKVLKRYLDKNNGNLTKALQNYNGTSNNSFSDKVYKSAGRFAIFSDYRQYITTKDQQ